jgi:hypothetical protein
MPVFWERFDTVPCRLNRVLQVVSDWLSGRTIQRLNGDIFWVTLVNLYGSAVLSFVPTTKPLSSGFSLVKFMSLRVRVDTHVDMLLLTSLKPYGTA